jgi:formylglycine-generating enzyme required for sulfatase activity
MKLAHIPPGEFVMGSPETEAGRVGHETQHKVILTRGFYIGINTVTQAQWKAVMGESASRFKGDDLPVDEVLWNDAVTFCKELSEKEGKRYRLPTEAEWEYACRACTTRVMVRPRWVKRVGTAATATPKRHIPPVRNNPTPGACTTCTATFGSGVATGTASILMTR